MNPYARLLLLACLLLPTVAEARVWKLRNGLVVEGELERASEFYVHIKTGPKGTFPHPRYGFSDEDKAYLDEVAPIKKPTFERKANGNKSLAEVEYDKKVKEYAKSEQAMLRREAQEAELASAKAARKAQDRRDAEIADEQEALAQVEREKKAKEEAARRAAQEKARLELIASQKREREAIAAAALAAEAELESLRQKRAELAAAERARQKWDKSLADMYNSIPAPLDLLRAGRLIKGLVLVVVLVFGCLFWCFRKVRQVAA